MAAQGTFQLVAEAVQGTVVMTHSIPTVNPTIATIKLQSTDFPTNARLSFSLFIEESFDGGATWRPASGFPSTATGGNAGQPTKGGGVSDGLPSWQYAYDGPARQLRVTMSPFVDGLAGSYDWGLTATLA